LSSPQAPSDAELANRLKAGDTDALGQLYERHVRGIHDYLARFTRDPAAAEDLTHSTFLRAWEGRSALRDPSKVRAWLYATAHHLALNHVTRGPAAEAMDEEAAGRVADPARGPEAEAIAREAAELVWSAASSLEARQYAVLDLSVRQGLSTREIADVLGVPVAHAAVLVNRGREALGNAVRYLLVARRRDHCRRLAELVPAGVRVLTAQERSAVDHHMRRCENCRELGLRLTAPAQLLGALLPLPVPLALAEQGRQRLVASVHAQPAAAAAGGSGSWPPRRPIWDGRGRWATGLAIGLALLVLGGGTATFLLRAPAVHPGPPGSALPAVGPAVAGPVAAPSPSPTITAPSPSATPAGIPSGTTTVPGPPPVETRPTPTPDGGTPTPGPTPVVTPTPSPTPVPATVPPTRPPLAVLSVVVRAPGPLGCVLNQLLQLFGCDFTVLVELAPGSSQGPVQVTLTATPTQGPPAVVQFLATAGVPASVTVRFAGQCPSGVATATTTPASAIPGNQATFGRC